VSSIQSSGARRSPTTSFAGCWLCLGECLTFALLCAGFSDFPWTPIAFTCGAGLPPSDHTFTLLPTTPTIIYNAHVSLHHRLSARAHTDFRERDQICTPVHSSYIVLNAYLEQNTHHQRPSLATSSLPLGTQSLPFALLFRRLVAGVLHVLRRVRLSLVISPFVMPARRLPLYRLCVCISFSFYFGPCPGWPVVQLSCRLLLALSFADSARAASLSCFGVYPSVAFVSPWSFLRPSHFSCLLRVASLVSALVLLAALSAGPLLLCIVCCLALLSIFFSFGIFFLLRCSFFYLLTVAVWPVPHCLASRCVVAAGSMSEHGVAFW